MRLFRIVLAGAVALLVSVVDAGPGLLVSAALAQDMPAEDADAGLAAADPPETDPLDEHLRRIEVLTRAARSEEAGPSAAVGADGDLADPADPADGTDAATVPPEPEVEEPTSVEPEAPADGDLAADGKLIAPIAEEEALAAETVNRPPPDETPGDFAIEERTFAPYADRDEESSYAAPGIRVGSFIAYPDMRVGAVYDDNVFRTGTLTKSDRALELAPGLRLESDWSRHALAAEVSALRSYHETYDSEDDRELAAALRGRLDITDRTTLAGELGYDFGQEGRGSADGAGLGEERADVSAHSASVTLGHRFNRLFGRLRGSGLEEDYSGSGTDGEDFVEGGIAVRVGYDLSPELGVFAEAEWGERDYRVDGTGATPSRDFESRTVRAGVIADIAAKLRGELAVGYARHTPADDRLEGIDGAIADGRLIWQPSALTTLTLSAASGIEATSLSDSIGAFSNSASLELRHEFRRYFAALAGVGYGVKDYAGTSVSERELAAHLGAEYDLNRYVVLDADYRHVLLDSSEPGADYRDNTLRFGVTVRR